MATPPQKHKIVLQFERTYGISERYPTSIATYHITTNEAETMVERDLAIRKASANDPDLVKPRSFEEIANELSKHDYNNAKKYLRHNVYRSAAGRDNEDEVSIIDVSTSGEVEDPAERWRKAQAVSDVLGHIDELDRQVLVAIHIHGYTQAQVAKALRVSQPAVAKRLKRAEKKFRKLYSDEGL